MKPKLKQLHCGAQVVVVCVCTCIVNVSVAFNLGHLAAVFHWCFMPWTADSLLPFQ